MSAADGQVTAVDLGYNARIASDASTTFGYQVVKSGDAVTGTAG